MNQVAAYYTTEMLLLLLFLFFVVVFFINSPSSSSSSLSNVKFENNINELNDEAYSDTYDTYSTT